MSMKRVVALVLLICTLFCVFGVSACSELGDKWIELDGSNEGKGGGSQEGQQAGEQQGTEQENNQQSGSDIIHTGDIINNVTSNTVTINGQSSDVTYAAASGLRSAVSVYCMFEKTVTSGNPWNPTVSTQKYYSAGAGVIYRTEADGSAFIVTNFHVVYDGSSNSEMGISEEINVYLYGKEADEYAIPAIYVGGSALYDVAVLRVSESEVLSKALESGAAQAITLGSSDGVYPGQVGIAIGNPAGYGISVTRGIVSVDSEYISMTAPDNSGNVTYRVIRIDTPINSGNSGGGLYNGNGELIGIVNAKMSSSSVENIGYAIPVAIVRAVADNIIDYCFETECYGVMRSIIGLSVIATDVYTAYDTETGLFIKRETVSIGQITAGGLAAGAGLSVDDVIKTVKIGERAALEITKTYHFVDAMLDARVDDVIVITYIDAKSGLQETATITVTQECITEY